MIKPLRIVDVEIIDSSNITVKFSHELISSLTVSNVSITAESDGVPNSSVLSVKVLNDILSINCQPLTTHASYFLIFNSTDFRRFSSPHDDYRLVEDGVSNRYLITGPLEADNPVKTYLTSYLREGIYNADDEKTLIAKYINGLSVNISRALYDIRQLKNENYLSFDIVDEQKIRGVGPSDRLNEEGAYEIVRIARTPTQANASKSYTFSEFPSYPITLQRQLNTESLTPSSDDTSGTFNINSLVMNLSNTPITKIISIIFTFNTAESEFVYDIESFGYQIKNSRYDQDYGFTYLSLEDNQIKINEKVLEDSNFILPLLLRVDVEYETKDFGKIIDDSSVVVFTTENVIREVLPPVINIFQLKYAPILDSNGDIPTIGGLTITDPNSIVVGAKHPAFLYEIPFRLNALPVSIGQYSIDYETGTVYVYGQDSRNDGTGAYPPLVSYSYKLTYKEELDYVYDIGLRDIVALPHGNLLDYSGTINFDYEQVLVPNVDYVCTPHKEILEERINNKLVALNVLKTQNTPITNVFRIFNETSGEIYSLNRWYENKIYFNYITPPRILEQVGERVSFKDQTNQLLFIDTSLTNSNLLTVYKILLNDNNIVSSSEDSLASSINTSLVLSNADIFSKEKWFNRSLDIDANIDVLENVGEYCVDYINGVIYCAVISDQDGDLGTASYKTSHINPVYPHIISVNDLYSRITLLSSKEEQFPYSSFDDGDILPTGLVSSDQIFINENESGPYQLSSGSIGVFSDLSFSSGVTHQIKNVRAIYEYEDLTNSTHPINFVNSSTSSGSTISVSSIDNEVFGTIIETVDGYTITLEDNVPYLSSNITFSFSVIRTSDSLELWDSSGTIVAGGSLQLILSGINSPNDGDSVKIIYSISINDLSRVVIDYNKGDLFVDYTYLADEIIVSYEYGDNVVDFRQNTNLPPGSPYYVTYKAGALRDALLSNFGNLVNIPELLNFDIDFERERYRDALIAALSSFIKGPTVNAIKNIGSIISHVAPEISESVFEGWSLGNSILNPQTYTTTGEFQLLPCKYGDGVLISESDQTIKIPANSNIRFEEGTFETWVLPQWNGLDNDAELSFTILKDNVAIDEKNVFIGAMEYHPTITDGVFSINKSSNVIGTPNTNKDGVFIYYDLDSTGSFNRWYVSAIDGYVNSPSSTYKIRISSTGSFYNTKIISGNVLPTTKLITGVNTLTLTLTGGSPFDEGVTFISDVNHYVLDVGKEVNNSRLSIFKDPSGYLNFKVIDKNGLSSSVSADISSWKSNELHFIAASWKINSKNSRDEIHLFIDGEEVPNIIKYNQKLTPYLHEKFRTVDPEEIVGLSTSDIIGSNDLVTTSGSSVVSSSIPFGSYNIFAGDRIYIDEDGFDELGYEILIVDGQSLTLDSNMPSTLTDGRFSVNRTEYTVTSEIDIYPNIAVSKISSILSGSDISGTIDTNQVSSSVIDFSLQDISAGNLIRILDDNLPIVYTILDIDGYSLTIDGYLPIELTNESFYLYDDNEIEIPGIRALRPSYSISKDGYYNNILTISNSVDANDLVLIRTLGLNNRRIKKKYYVWSDDVENILMTKLPPPISLDEVNITKVILPLVPIGSSNSTLVSDVFESSNIVTYQPSNSQNGRTLSVTLSGTNIDFSQPVVVTIEGTSDIYTVTESINFTDYGTIDFTNLYFSVNYIQVSAKPINTSKPACNIEIKEKYVITYSESSGLVPVIRYSYPMASGISLYSDGYGTITDDNQLFSRMFIGNYIIIQSPITVAGYYIITDVSDDRKSLTIESTVTGFTVPLDAFTDGTYQIVNTSNNRTGLQNGYFRFESTLLPSQEYFLNSGFYEFDYYSYASMPFDPVNNYLYIGSDINGDNQANMIIDQIKIYSTMLTDTRIGEVIPSTQSSITKTFNSIKPLKKDSTTILLTTFNSYPFENNADCYINSNSGKMFQSSTVVNENFNNSIVIKETPIVVDNNGILDTRKEGTIEFWTSPIYDTGNDPSERYYFDAFGAVIEEVVSINNNSVKINSPISNVLSVKLKNGDQSIDYFAGGKIEIDTQNAATLTITNTNIGFVESTKSIFQVISVKILNDLSNKDYFKGGLLGSDNKKIYLGTSLPSTGLSLVIAYQPLNSSVSQTNTQIIRLNKRLPSQKSTVLVNYIPSGLQGDRISIYKDSFGIINFRIIASGEEYIVCGPSYWDSNSWHRIKASYKVNSSNNQDEMRLFIDGYQYGNVLFGDFLTYGNYASIPGISFPGDGYNSTTTIKFNDSINQFIIGNQYSHDKPLFALIDNFRISNIFRPIYSPYSEPIDVNYSSNLDIVFPVTEDLFTTYLMDYDSEIVLNTDFANIVNRNTGLFDFSINILDSFGIVSSSEKVKEILEKLIKILKPANSKVFIRYI
jgi:hypothetical protein